MAGLERTVCSFWVLHVPPVCEWLSDRDTGQKGSHDPCLMSSLGRHFVPLSRPSIQRRLERSHYTPPFSRLMPVPHRFFFISRSEHKKRNPLKNDELFSYLIISDFVGVFQFERPGLSRGTFGPVSTRSQVLDKLIAPSPCSFE